MSEEELAKRANDFEEKHGYCPDYGYDVEMNKTPEEYNEIMSEGLANVLYILHKQARRNNEQEDVAEEPHKDS